MLLPKSQLVLQTTKFMIVYFVINKTTRNWETLLIVLLQIIHTVGLRMLSPGLDKQGLLTSYDWVTENICFFWRGSSLAEHSIVLLCMCVRHIAALVWNEFMENSQSEGVGGWDRVWKRHMGCVHSNHTLGVLHEGTWDGEPWRWYRSTVYEEVGCCPTWTALGSNLL